ncbi:MAG: hypothetical protein GF355_15310 [Candidatus Eisenbacteria bacterium]|nr:hypothetical protein [Candidatus Eisenbacteria bacterium]
MLVEDNPAEARVLQGMLSEAIGGDPRLPCVPRCSEVRRHLEQDPANVVLVENSSSGASETDSIHGLMADAAHLPVIALFPSQDDGLTTGAVRAGAQDFPG